MLYNIVTVWVCTCACVCGCVCVTVCMCTCEVSTQVFAQGSFLFLQLSPLCYLFLLSSESLGLFSIHNPPPLIPSREIQTKQRHLYPRTAVSRTKVKQTIMVTLSFLQNQRQSCQVGTSYHVTSDQHTRRTSTHAHREAMRNTAVCRPHWLAHTTPAGTEAQSEGAVFHPLVQNSLQEAWGQGSFQACLHVPFLHTAC